MKRAALYVRVSTEEQKKHGLSVDAQVDALKKFCDDNGYIVHEIYNDAGYSARKSYKRRPALNKMVKDCQSGKIDIILLTKLDRFFRSVKDYYEVMGQIGEIPWRAIWEDYETETSAGIFKVNIMLAVAQSEADRTSERIKSTFAYKRSCGDYVGYLPKGYKRIDGKICINEEYAEMIHEMFRTYMLTFSTQRTYECALRYGWQPSLATIRRTLDNQIYCGVLPGMPDASCPAYITKEQHEQIVESFKKRTRDNHRKRDYIFRGLCFCEECGSRMNGIVKRTKRGEFYDYICRGQRSGKAHTPCSLSEKKIEKYLLANIEYLVGEYNVTANAEFTTNEMKEARKRKESLEKKLERIGIRFENGDFEFDEYKKKSEEVKQELALIRFPERKDPIVLPENWKDAYDMLDREHKAQFWRTVVSEIRIDGENGKSIHVVLI